MTGPVSVLVVDDEPLARERIRWLLERVPTVEACGYCNDGEDAVGAIVQDRPDLVLLDVQMPRLDGLGVIDRVGVASMPYTIFVTAYDRYAVQAFERRALDYLVKPYSDERFFEAIERGLARIHQDRLVDFSGRLAALLHDAPLRAGSVQSEASAELESATGPLERFAVRTGDKVHIVRADAVDWISAEGVYVRLHAGRQTYLLREPMHHLEARLDARRFVRIHRSAIVNVDRIRELREEDRGDYRVVLHDGAVLRLSRSRRINLERILGSSL